MMVVVVVVVITHFWVTPNLFSFSSKKIKNCTVPF